MKKSVQVLELKMQNIERSFNNLEQLSRRDCLEFSGVAVTSNENTDDFTVQVNKTFFVLKVSMNNIPSAGYQFILPDTTFSMAV